MDYEKKYKEALTWMQSLYDGLHGATKKDAEHYFPELAESEDEKVRKTLIRFFEDWRKTRSHCWGVSIQKILAWLEKQKEFVSADFDDVWETADCEELTAPLEKYSKEAIKKMCHAWYDKGIELERRKWLEKQGEQKPAWSYEDEANLNNIIWLCNNCIKGSETTWIPSQATKIKHLIETIKEKGLVQQNPAWSEEDKKTLERVIRCIENHDYMNVDDIQWLKSIKDRYTWKPSDEQMIALNDAILLNEEENYNGAVLSTLREQLKKLK